MVGMDMGRAVIIHEVDGAVYDTDGKEGEPFCFFAAEIRGQGQSEGAGFPGIAHALEGEGFDQQLELYEGGDRVSRKAEYVLAVPHGEQGGGAG